MRESMKKSNPAQLFLRDIKTATESLDRAMSVLCRESGAYRDLSDAVESISLTTRIARNGLNDGLL